MIKTIESFIKEILLEITRYERETGKKYNPIDDFRSKISEHPCEYAFTMVKIKKVGVNPKPIDQDTPAAVYAFPLNQKYFDLFMSNSLPGGIDAPYVGLLKLNMKNKEKWLYFNSQDNQSFKKVKEAALMANSSYYSDEYFEYADYAKSQGFENETSDGNIWNLARQYSSSKNSGPGQRAFKFTEFLRKLGYIGAYDEEQSVIHHVEPSQIALLEPSAYEVLEIYDTDLLRSLENLELMSDRGKARFFLPKLIQMLSKGKQLTNTGKAIFNEKLKVALNYENFSPSDLMYFHEIVAKDNLPNDSKRLIASSENFSLRMFCARRAFKMPDDVLLKLEKDDPEIRSTLIDSIRIGLVNRYEFEASLETVREVVDQFKEDGEFKETSFGGRMGMVADSVLRSILGETK